MPGSSKDQRKYENVKKEMLFHHQKRVEKKQKEETEGDIMCGAYSHIVQSCQNVQRSEENDNQLEVGNVPRAAWREVTKGDPVKGHWEWVWK
jgi:hypothetical protein